METVLIDESPLAAYLDGRDDTQSEDDQPTPSPSGHPPHPISFAPTSNMRKMTPRTPRLVSSRLAQNRLLSKARDIYAAAISSTLGPEDNTRFLEHFRYIVIASQLLDEHVGPSSASTRPPNTTTHLQAQNAVSYQGATITALSAFFFIWLIHWTRNGKATPLFWGRTALALILLPVCAILLYAYSRRQWLKYLRTQAVDTATSFTEQAHNFETSSTNTITLIQEVELVSRGYRLSTPLPPISRLEGRGTDRRCARLRQELSKAYKAAIEASVTAIVGLGHVADHNDLERFLEVYDIRWQDLDEARRGFVDSDEDERDSLRTLRVHQFRLSVLRRLIMCSLLSIPATGRKTDAIRWRTAITEMDCLGSTLAQLAGNLAKRLDDEDMPTPLSPTSPSLARQSPQKAHLQSQVRRIATLTTTIRSLQAKLFLLREDSTRALSASTSEADVNTISASLREQYENLGGDLTSLMSAWEAGKSALQHDITRHSRRVSRSGSLSMALSPLTNGSSPGTPQTPRGASFGLATLTEDRRAHALRSLNGEHGMDDTTDLPLSPPATDDGNNASNSDTESRDEVFEAISIPPIRERSTLTREQRIAKMKEERVAAAQARESRDAGLNMVRELQAVIKMRPQRAPSSASKDKNVRNSDPSGRVSPGGSADVLGITTGAQHGRISSL